MVGALVLVVLVAAAGVLAAGLYDVGADEPHWSMTERVLGLARLRAVKHGMRDVPDAPNLEDAALLRKGAATYADMCAPCHTAPGRQASLMSQGMYPRPPDLARVSISPRAAFWTIKHGLKMTGMPAWGASHDDTTIWAMVAFIRQLPRMSPQQYEAMLRSAPREEAMPGGHSHGGVMSPAHR